MKEMPMGIDRDPFSAAERMLAAVKNIFG